MRVHPLAKRRSSDGDRQHGLKPILFMKGCRLSSKTLSLVHLFFVFQITFCWLDTYLLFVFSLMPSRFGEASTPVAENLKATDHHGSSP